MEVTVDLAGQLVTLAAQEVIVTSSVAYTVMVAETAEAMKATAAMENCILSFGWWVGVGEGGLFGEC